MSRPPIQPLPPHNMYTCAVHPDEHAHLSWRGSPRGGQADGRRARAHAAQDSAGNTRDAQPEASRTKTVRIGAPSIPVAERSPFASRPSTRLLFMLTNAPFRPHSLFSLLCTALAILLLCTSLGLAEGIASALGIGLDSFAQRNVTNWVHFQKDFLPSFKSVECYESSTFQFSQVWDKRGSTLHFELLASDVGSSGLFVREEGWAGLLSPSSGWRNWKLGKKICTVP